MVRRHNRSHSHNHIQACDGYDDRDHGLSVLEMQDHHGHTNELNMIVPNGDDDMQYEAAIRDYIKAGYRVYFTTERDIQHLRNLTTAFGVNKTSFIRLFDVIVFPDKTIREILPRLDDANKIIANAIFEKGEYKHPSRLLIGKTKE